MEVERRKVLRRVVVVLTGLLVVKVTLNIVVAYRDYFPADFGSDFLRGREAYFYGGYHWAFYAHLLAGPVSLIVGLILISDVFRARFPTWHRRLGRWQGMLILFVLAPSGLWMAFYAETGTVAAIGFALLAIATGFCVILGWRRALQRRFAEHQRWMLRCFLLLCSAVVLRWIGGLTIVTGMNAEWSYAVAAWVSWLLPLAIFELSQWWASRRLRREHVLELFPSTVAGDCDPGGALPRTSYWSGL